MSRRRKVLLTVTVPEKITSRTGPMSRRHVDETPLLRFQERTFSFLFFFCQTSLPSMPKHSPRAVNFFFLFPSRSLTASKPMSQLMQTGSRGVCACVCGVVVVVVVVVVGQSTFPGRVSGAVNRFLSHMHFYFDGCGSLSRLLSTTLHHSTRP